jgi:hypothetical protein
VKVIKSGVIPIIDSEAIIKVLGGRGVNGEIVFYNKDNLIYIETDKDQYEISQRENVDVKILKKKDIVKTLEIWVKTHDFDGDNDVLVLHHPTKGDYPYSMRLDVNKDDLLKVVGDSLNITKDNKTRLVFDEDEVLKGYTGANNSPIKSNHIIEYKDTGNELMFFDKDFYGIQSIIPNLFDKIELNFRYVETKDMIIVYIRSIDEKKNMEIHMSLTSIIKVKTK